MQPWIWHNIHVDLPDDWEMLMFSKNPDAGRCTFADRYRFRFELSWKHVPGPPDLDRMFSDYVSKLKLDKRADDIGELQRGVFKGFAGTIDGENTSRFGRYFNTEELLVELVFLWPGARDVELEDRVLHSTRVAAPVQKGMRHWRAFGLDLLARDDLALKESRVEPGRARLNFCNRRNGPADTYHRLGIVSLWLKGSVADWLNNQLDASARVDHRESVSINGHDIEFLRGDTRAPGLKGVIGGRLNCDAAAWICPGDKRLYGVQTVHKKSDAAGQRARPADLAGGRLTCCSMLKAGS